MRRRSGGIRVIQTVTEPVFVADLQINSANQQTSGFDINMSNSTIDSLPISTANSVEYTFKLDSQILFRMEGQYASSLSISDVATELTSYSPLISNAVTSTSSGLNVLDNENGLHAILVASGLISSTNFDNSALNKGYSRTIEAKLSSGGFQSSAVTGNFTNIYAPITFTHEGAETFDIAISNKHAIVWGDGASQVWDGSSISHAYTSETSGEIWGVPLTDSIDGRDSKLTAIDLRYIVGDNLNIDFYGNNIATLTMPVSGSYSAIDFEYNNLSGVLNLSNMSQSEACSIQARRNSLLTDVTYGTGGSVGLLALDFTGLSGNHSLPKLLNAELRVNDCPALTGLTWNSDTGQSVRQIRAQTCLISTFNIPNQVSVSASQGLQCSNNRMSLFSLPVGSTINSSFSIGSQSVNGISTLDLSNYNISVSDFNVAGIGAGNPVSINFGAANSITVKNSLQIQGNDYSASGISVAAFTLQSGLFIQLRNCNLSSSQQESVMDEWIAKLTGTTTGTINFYLVGGSNAALEASALSKKSILQAAGWTVNNH